MQLAGTLPVNGEKSLFVVDKKYAKADK